MTYEIYHLVFLCAGILSIILAVITILLFVFLKIPKVVGDLSGATARKAIADIREQNIQTGDKRHKTSHVNMERGRITDRITESGNIQRVGTSVQTGIVTQKIDMPAISEPSETVVLPEMEYPETEVLNGIQLEKDFMIEEEICFIHTNETIG